MNYFNDIEQINLMVCRHGDTDLHNHDFMEMVYVTQGRAIHTLNSKETLICEGDYFIIDYGAYHKYTKISDCDYEIINVLFKPEFIDKSLIGCKSFRDLINNYTIKFSYTALQHDPTDIIYKDDNGLIYLLIQKLQDEYFNKGAGYLELMRCFLIEVIISTMRKIKKTDSAPAYNDCTKFIVDYIDNNFEKQFTLGGLGDKLNYSLPYLSRKFKEDTGLSFVRYLQKKRIEQSCRLLLNTDKKINEIAELVGYNDVKFFNRIFKEYLKTTPREFKKIHKH